MPPGHETSILHGDRKFQVAGQKIKFRLRPKLNFFDDDNQAPHRGIGGSLLWLCHAVLHCSASGERLKSCAGHH